MQRVAKEHGGERTIMRILASTEAGFPGPEAWDRLVAQDRRGHLLQTWAWGELKGAFGWVPLRLALERDGVFVAGAQVLFRRFGPLTLGYIPKGPVLAEESEEVIETLWRALHAHARRMRAVALKVEPEWREEAREGLTWLHGPEWRPSAECIQPRRTIIVDLKPTEEEILARMKPKWRYNIHLSARKGIEVSTASAPQIDTFYHLMQITGVRDAFAIHSRDYYQRALELFEGLGRVRLFVASYAGQPLASLMAYAFNGQSWYMYGASSDEHRELMPNHQLQWRAMQWAKAQGCMQYDLWGIPDVATDSPTAALTGVERFKAGFGGEVVRYVGAYDHVYSAPLYALMNRALAYRRARASVAGGDTR
jgi:peptidoglycan pentaglycine glycine transferase (the first glycine)